MRSAEHFGSRRSFEHFDPLLRVGLSSLTISQVNCGTGILAREHAGKDARATSANCLESLKRQFTRHIRLHNLQTQQLCGRRRERVAA